MEFPFSGCVPVFHFAGEREINEVVEGWCSWHVAVCIKTEASKVTEVDGLTYAAMDDFVSTQAEKFF